MASSSQYEAFLASLRESLEDLKTLDAPEPPQEQPVAPSGPSNNIFSLDEDPQISEIPQLTFLSPYNPPSESPIESRSPEASVFSPVAIAASPAPPKDASYVEDFEDFNDRSPSPVDHSPAARALVIRSRTQSPRPRRSPQISRRSPRHSAPGFCVLKCPRCTAVWPLSAGFTARKFLGAEPGGRDLFSEAFGDEISDRGFDLSPILSVRDLSPAQALEILKLKFPDAPKALVFWWRGLQCMDEEKISGARENCRRAFATLPVGRLALPLHWHWALLYERDWRQLRSPQNRKPYERELRELRRVQSVYGGGGTGSCSVCGRKS